MILCCSGVSGAAQQTEAQIPDSIAYTAIYYVVHDAPKPHWDRETCLTWLKERGLSDMQAHYVFFAANRYMKKHAAIEEELRIVNTETGNSLAPQVQHRRSEIETRRSLELTASIKQLQQDFGSGGAAKLAGLILNVKQDINMKKK